MPQARAVHQTARRGSPRIAAWPTRTLRLDAVPRFALKAGWHLLEAVVSELGSYDTPIERFLRGQAAWLQENLLTVRTELEPLGIRVLEAESLWGLSCLLDLRGVTDKADEWVVRLEAQAGVRLNTPTWSGTPGFARLCLSVPQEHLREGIRRMRDWIQHT